jgi:flagellar assembly protein FliH
MFLYKHIARNAPVTSFGALLKPVEKAPVLGKIVRTAAEIEELRNSAKEAGYNEGRHDGYQMGFAEGVEDGKVAGYAAAFEEAAANKKEELDTLSGELHRLVHRIEAAMHKWYGNSEPALAQLAVLIASRVIAAELKTSPEAVLAIVKEAVAEVTHATSARIKVNPFDSAVLQENRDAILSTAGSLRQLEIVEDIAIPGGCIIESEGGVVDATIDMKLRETLSAIRSAA